MKISSNGWRNRHDDWSLVIYSVCIIHSAWSRNIVCFFFLYSKHKISSMLRIHNDFFSILTNIQENVKVTGWKFKANLKMDYLYWYCYLVSPFGKSVKLSKWVHKYDKLTWTLKWTFPNFHHLDYSDMNTNVKI